MSKKNVLIFPGGSEIGLELNRALRYSTHLNIIGGCSVNDHTKFVFENYIENIPFISEKKFIQYINKTILAYDIDFIFPAHDSVVFKLAKAYNAGNLNCPVVTSSFETVKICRSKLDTYHLFKDIILVPEIFDKSKIQKRNFPLFLKPNIGQGSKGTKKINSWEELEFYLKKDSSLLILEYLPGNEYTIDCFTNRNNQLIFCKGRERRRILNGISMNAISEDDSRFQDIAEKINNILKFQGMWFFQLKKNKNEELVLLEISPRVAGTMGYHRLKGTNLPLMALFDQQGIEVQVIYNQYSLEMDRALGNNYKINFNFEHIYLDLDDTLLFGKKVNTKLISLLYQFKNENKKMYLITAHKEKFGENVKKTLKNCFIDTNLFTKILDVNLNESKSKYIKYKNSIFIDDSYSKRQEVFKNAQIPVFDVCAVKALLK